MFVILKADMVRENNNDDTKHTSSSNYSATVDYRGSPGSPSSHDDDDGSFLTEGDCWEG